MRGDGSNGSAGVGAPSIDSVGDIVVGGARTSINSGDRRDSTDLFVVKLDGRHGTERWRYELHDLTRSDSAAAVAFNAGNDVFALALLASSYPSPQPTYFILKLSGSTGSLVWRSALDFPAQSLTVEPSGDAIVGGGSAGGAFTFARLSAGTGTRAWETLVPRPTSAGLHSFLSDMGLSPFGDIVAVALGGDTIGMSIDGATGDPRWLQILDRVVRTETFVQPLALGANGRVVVAGQDHDSPFERDGLVYELDGMTGEISRTEVLKHAAQVSGVAVGPDGDIFVAGRRAAPYERATGFVTRIGALP